VNWPVHPNSKNYWLAERRKRKKNKNKMSIDPSRYVFGECMEIKM
jgi:hypothetical protein